MSCAFWRALRETSALAGQLIDVQVKLRPGRYTVRATYKNRDQTKTVSIASKGSTQVAFYWNVE